MNLRFVARSLLLAIPVALLLAVAGLLILHAPSFFGPLPDPTPPPPAISVPGRPMPEGWVVAQEWVTATDGTPNMVGCGFFLAAGEKRQVAVTTAHSLNLEGGLPDLAFRFPDRPESRIDFEGLAGPPGRARSGEDLTVDYLLLTPASEPPVTQVLTPDPRGQPQPGERVTLYKCFPDGNGQPQRLEGTVQQVTGTGFWVLMDRPVAWGVMNGSGSPFVSNHSGQVVGMLIAGTVRGGHPFFGAHPVGSLVALAAIAEPASGVEEACSDLSATTELDLTVAPLSQGRYELQISLLNQATRVLFLPVCGPWEVSRESDPSRPVWLTACEIDYLGYQVKPGQVFSDQLSLELEPGRYQVRTTAFSDCELPPPKEVSSSETYFGPFEACGCRQELLSAAFEIAN